MEHVKEHILVVSHSEFKHYTCVKHGQIISGLQTPAPPPPQPLPLLVDGDIKKIMGIKALRS